MYYIFTNDTLYHQQNILNPNILNFYRTILFIVGIKYDFYDIVCNPCKISSQGYYIEHSCIENGLI